MTRRGFLPLQWASTSRRSWRQSFIQAMQIRSVLVVLPPISFYFLHIVMRLSWGGLDWVGMLQISPSKWSSLSQNARFHLQMPFFQGMFKFTDGRQLPPDYRNLKGAGGDIGGRKVVLDTMLELIRLTKRNWKNMWKPLQLRQSCTGMHRIGIKTSKGLVFDGLTRIRFENLNCHHITTLLRKDWCSISILPSVVHFKHGPLSTSIFPGFRFWRFNKN